MLTEVLLRALTGRMSRQQALLLFAEGKLDALLSRVNPWDGNSVQEFAQAAAEVAVAAQRQAVTLVAATQRSYLSAVDIDLDFTPEVPDEVRGYNPERVSKFAKPRLVRVNGEKVERLPIEEVFNRPAREFRRNVAAGMDESKALAMSANRAKILMRTNVALAEREAKSQIYAEAKKKSPKLIGYRRVIHPEASTTGVCGLCLAASDRMYFVDDLDPIHDNCKCEPLPVTKSSDPGAQLNAEDLGRLYDLAGSTAAKQLSKVKFKVEEHGELGAVLVPSGPGDVPHFQYRDAANLNAEAEADDTPLAAAA